MAKPAGTKSTIQSLNKSAPARPGAKGANAPATVPDRTSGGKGDKDGKGDIQAKKANTSSSKKSASK